MKIKIDKIEDLIKILTAMSVELYNSNILLRQSIENTKSDDYEDLLKRIAEVEVKISKMWDLLITKSPVTKEDKPSSYAKKYFNRSLLK